MNNILKRDITGECFGECRNTVREAEVKRQAQINKIIREAKPGCRVAEGFSGKESSDHSSRVSSAS